MTQACRRPTKLAAQLSLRVSGACKYWTLCDNLVLDQDFEKSFGWSRTRTIVNMAPVCDMSPCHNLDRKAVETLSKDRSFDYLGGTFHPLTLSVMCISITFTV